MIPRTVKMAAEIAATFTPPQLDDYGNIILNGYVTTNSAVTTTGAVGGLNALTITTAGTGYTNGTYTCYVGGAKGYFGYATIVVAGGIVTTATVTSAGQNYVKGSTVSVSGIGPGSGLVLTVASVDQNNRRPALKGWTNNYQEYYTQLQPNDYDVNPGDPTMFEYNVHSYTQATGTILTVGNLQAGYDYTPGTYTNVPTVGGSGTGATLDIVVGVGGVVTSAVLNAVGSGYTVGDGLTVTTLGAGREFSVNVLTITTVSPAGQPKWAQAPRRLINATVSPFVPPNTNNQAIQYSAILYPVSDSPLPPPTDSL